MDDVTQLKEFIIKGYHTDVEGMIETQAILQLLVKKNIVTPDEVKEMRQIVRRQPKYTDMLKTISASLDAINEAAKFENLFTKSLTEGPDKLSKEEKDYLLNELDNIGIWKNK